MKTVGIIGGMSWQSSAKYYEWINQGIFEKLGGLHSGKILLSSINFAGFEKHMVKDDWDKCAEIIIHEAKKLEQAGVDFIVISTNTVHLIADQVQDAISIPLLHIAEATAENILEQNIQKVALLGTIYTMEKDFYKKHLEQKDIEVLIPEKNDRIEINRIIFEELCQGKIVESSKNFYEQTIENFRENEAQGIILGCTELNMLVKNCNNINIFDTTKIHIKKTIEKMLI